MKSLRTVLTLILFSVGFYTCQQSEEIVAPQESENLAFSSNKPVLIGEPSAEFPGGKKFRVHDPKGVVHGSNVASGSKFFEVSFDQANQKVYFKRTGGSPEKQG